jgi:hypothetical protein
VKKKATSLKYYRVLTNSFQMSKTVTLADAKKLATHFDNEEMPSVVNNIVYGHFKLSLKQAD